MTETDKEKLARLEAENEALKERIANNRSVPEFSAVFVNAKDRSPIKWNHLSETKRYLEKNQPEILKAIVAKAAPIGEDTVTSKEFHESMVDVLLAAF